MTRLRRLLSSTFFRTISGYILVAVVLAGAWIYSLAGPLTDAVVSQQERNLKAVAQSAALVVGESDESPQLMAKQLVTRTDVRLTIIAADGRVIADSDFEPSQMENHSSRPEVREALLGRTGVDRRVSTTEGDEQVYVAVPGSLVGERVAVRVAQSLREIRRIADRLRRFGLTLLALALSVAVFIAWRVTRSTAQPIQELTAVSRQMAEGNLSVRIPDAPADLVTLADSLGALRDQMKVRLDALDTERSTLRSALDGLTDAVFVVEGGKAVISNGATKRLFDSAVIESEGKSLDELPIPASLKAALREELESPTPDGVEVGPDPTGRSWRVIVARLASPGPTVRSIVVVADITERARLERVRREFVANASHELKTPVAAIKLLAESATMAAGDGDQETSSAFLGQISGEVERLHRMVSDLLDLSRLEALPAPDSITDVRVAVDNALIGHRAAAERQGLRLASDFGSVSDVDVYVAADPTDVAIALDNLLSNAIRYTESGSVIVSVNVSEANVIIEVSDTGFGIPAEHLPRIFERFYRVDQGRARDSGGTGLGLALVRHVAERNGGSVSVSSEVGAGTTFTLRLPRHI